MSQDIVSLIPLFCDAFVGEAIQQGGIAFEAHLNRSLLDYSLESLHALDRYLTVLHQHADDIGDQQYDNTIVAAGGYLGEVIRRNARRNFVWMNYDEYIAKDPKAAKMIPECLPTSALLVTGNAMTMPLNKIARFIDEGPENNTHYYASVDIKQV